MEFTLYDAAGHRRSPATMPGFHQGRSPRNRGLRCPADPPTIEEIIAVMRAAGQSTDGARIDEAIAQQVAEEADGLLSIGAHTNLCPAKQPYHGALPTRRGGVELE